MVSGSVSSECGDKEIPSYFTRLDYPEIATFIADPSANVGKNGGTNIVMGVGGKALHTELELKFSSRNSSRNNSFAKLKI